MQLKTRYNLLHLFYWFAYCCISGFIAIFLQYLGLSNTEIGIVTGISCISTIFISPFISSLVDRIKNLTIKKLTVYITVGVGIVYLILSFIKMPAFMAMILYILMYALMLSTVPLLTMIAMNYINDGLYVNFGLARGIGSASWAASAFVFGQVISFVDPWILSIGYFFFIALALILLYTMPEQKNVKTTKEKQGSVLQVIKNYKILFFLLLGFCFMFAGATTIGTYLINIVTNLGGNTSLYGVCMFFMAFSELPVITMAPRLMKRFNSVTLIVIASVFYLLRNFTICLAPNLIILIIGMMFQGLSYGLFTGVITYYVTYNLDTKDQLAGQTLIGIMTSGIGSTLGNVLGGILQDTFGLDYMFMFIYIVTITGALIIFTTKKINDKKNLAAS